MPSCAARQRAKIVLAVLDRARKYEALAEVANFAFKVTRNGEHRRAPLAYHHGKGARRDQLEAPDMKEKR